MFQAFVGSLPFTGPSQDTFREQHLREGAVFPAGFDSTLQRIVSRLLRKNPNARYFDARMAEALPTASRQLSPVLETLREAAVRIDLRKERIDADRRAATEAIEATMAAREQGRADLKELVEQMIERARQALPESRLLADNEQLLVGWEEARLMLVPMVMQIPAGEPILDVWALLVGYDGAPMQIVANLINQQVDTGSHWEIWQFSVKPGLTMPYPMSSTLGEHGFPDPVFHDQIFGISPGTETWDRRVRILDDPAQLLEFLLLAVTAVEAAIPDDS